LREIIHFGDQQVFANATTYTYLLFLNKKDRENFHFVQAHSLPVWRQGGAQLEGDILTNKLTPHEWNFIVGPGVELFERLSEMPVKLGDVASKIFQGLVTGADQVFIMNNVSKAEYQSNSTGEIYHIEPELMHPLCKGSVNLKRYNFSEITKSILFPYKLANGKAELLSAQELNQQFPNALAYLKENRQKLEARERGKWKHDKWYAFGRSQNLAEMEQKKILTPSIANRTSFTFDDSDFYYFVGSGGGGGGGYGIILRDEYVSINYLYLLGLLNSKLLDWFLKQASSTFRGGYYSCSRQFIEKIPIRTIYFSDSNEKTCHDRMVDLVEQMLELHKKLAATKEPQSKTIIQRQVETTDRQIDLLVYELYELTEEEIKIVEGS